jgi:tRNA threonylcarbamoyladenosine biosynthesis protein TsaB
MKILALDTATQSCSVAVTDEGSLSAELTIIKSQTHSKHLMELIHSVLGIAGFGVADLDGLAVTVGPGSFTGLRIGISTLKGLAHALDKPAVGISSLEALAWQCAQTPYLICPLLDARKGEVYGATYCFNEDQLIQKTSARAMIPEAVAEDIKSPCVFIGTGARLYRQDIVAAAGSLAHFVPEDQNMIRASSVAFLSMPRFEANDTDEIAGLVPHYIRKSDAELNFGR